MGFACAGSGSAEWMAASIGSLATELYVCQPHSNGVGSAFQARAVASSQSMISAGLAGV